MANKIIPATMHVSTEGGGQLFTQNREDEASKLIDDFENEENNKDLITKMRKD